jgi:hypothetical protein
MKTSPHSRDPLRRALSAKEHIAGEAAERKALGPKQASKAASAEAAAIRRVGRKRPT